MLGHAVAGIETREPEPDPLAPVPCPNCHAICAPVSRFCSSCGQALSVDAAEELEDGKGIIWGNPETVLAIAPEVPQRVEAAASPPAETARQQG